MEAIISSECAESHLWPDGDGQLWALLRPNKLPPRDKNTAQGRGTHLESIRIGQILLGKVAVDVPWRKRTEVLFRCLCERSDSNNTGRAAACHSVIQKLNETLSLVITHCRCPFLFSHYHGAIKPDRDQFSVTPYHIYLFEIIMDVDDAPCSSQPVAGPSASKKPPA